MWLRTSVKRKDSRISRGIPKWQFLRTCILAVKWSQKNSFIKYVGPLDWAWSIFFSVFVITAMKRAFLNYCKFLVGWVMLSCCRKSILHWVIQKGSAFVWDFTDALLWTKVITRQCNQTLILQPCGKILFFYLQNPAFQYEEHGPSNCNLASLFYFSGTAIRNCNYVISCTTVDKTSLRWYIHEEVCDLYVWPSRSIISPVKDILNVEIKDKQPQVRFQVLTAASMEIGVSWFLLSPPSGRLLNFNWICQLSSWSVTPLVPGLNSALLYMYFNVVG